MPKKTADEIRLLLAQHINAENDNFSTLMGNLKGYGSLTTAKQFIEMLEFSHKEKIELLEKIYSET